MTRSIPGDTVLLVEDDGITRQILARVLRLAGYGVLEAETGEQALMTLRAQRGSVDWLVTDVRLPGLVDGWIVADEFHMTHPLRPVIYTSAREADERRQVHGSCFLRKPLKPLSLLDALKSAAAARLTEATA